MELRFQLTRTLSFLETHSQSAQQKEVIQDYSTPKPDIRKDQWFEPFYTGEKIELDCNMPGDGWKYDWYKGSKHLIRDPTFTINSASPSDTGDYHCTAKRGDFSVDSGTLQVRVEEPPQPKLSIESDWKTFYPSEKVILKCSINSNEWDYEWFKNRYRLSRNKEISFSGNTLTISSAKASHSGPYFCRGKHRERPLVTTRRTEALQLRIYVNTPKPDIRKDQWFDFFYTGEKIQLDCNMPGDGWKYDWYKGSKHLIRDSTFTINSASPSDTGVYHCTAKRGDFPVNSGTLQVRVEDNTPKPDIIKDQFDFFYTGEKIQLDCNMPGEGWKYDWYKGSKHLIKQPIFTINSASPSDTGDYHCTAKRGDFPVDSETLQVRVEDLPKPQLSIESKWKTFYPSEKVILKCSINSNEWDYEWFRNRDQLSGDDDISFSGNTLSISSAKASHSGQYSCRGKHLKRTPVTTKQADALKLHIHDNTPKPDIRKDQWFEPFYTGEKIELDCNMPGDGWKYDWYKGSKHLIRDPTFAINSVSPSDTGDYHCTAKRGDFSVDSGTLQVRVEDQPQPKLSIESEWKTFYPKEKVILKCSINSNEWDYEWFNDGTQLSDDVDISFSGNTLTIISAKASHSGQYYCRGKHRERTLVTTRTTEALQLHIHVDTPMPDIRKDQWFDFFYTGEKVELGCNMPGDGWEYDWYKDSETFITDPTFNISSASFSDTGDYHCKAKRGDFSVDGETLQVRVEARPPAVLSLETELSDIMSGNILTLRCSVSDGRQWSYTWFENEQRLNESSDVFKVTATEENINSEFKCKGIRTERPLYSALSEGFTANNIVLKRKILLAISGCLVCFIVILIIGCLVLRITRKPEKKKTVQEDLFFSMGDSKNQMALPLEEYMDNSPTEMQECEKKEELFTDHVLAVHVDGVIEDEDSQAAEAIGLTSFKGL
ncbi:carcinoembryonic antigen-related cell adhesion molecule 5-like [Pimephales promelas]|uniref:carcinoembryonic antigen-related cell adhesion molecule 5-like n=1 Tax=Pimephales promelas TaxID=90988 RepID=UPI001955A359|nr:carcinoembryonic antigen-related cell adhesion molecule 5-like [Pimephales promelas]